MMEFIGCIRSVVSVAILSCASITLPGLMASASAQTAVTGGLSGVVADSTGAIVPNATVTIVNTTTGDTRVLTTNADGRYVAAFLKPGTFTISATAPTMQSNTTSVQILVGQQSVANLVVTPAGNKQIVTVSANN